MLSCHFSCFRSHSSLLTPCLCAPVWHGKYEGVKRHAGSAPLVVTLSLLRCVSPGSSVKRGSKVPDCVNALWVQVRVETRPQLTRCSRSPSGFFDLSQGQFALRHHVPEAAELRSQGAGEEERGERPPEQRWALLPSAIISPFMPQRWDDPVHPTNSSKAVLLSCSKHTFVITIESLAS